LLLVLRGTPATFDEELDSVARGRRRSLAQGSKESGVEVGYTRNPVVDDRRAFGNGPVSFGKRTTVLTASAVLTARTTMLAARNVAR
jgi:hypothetical protein